jgi:peroxiredoxin
LQAYQQILPALREKNTTLVAISPELPDSSRAMVDKNQLTFPVLSDLGNRVARLYGIVFRVTDALRAPMQQLGIELSKFNGDDSWELPIPATYVVARDGSIRLAYVDADYRKRLEPHAILDALA